MVKVKVLQSYHDIIYLKLWEILLLWHNIRNLGSGRRLVTDTSGHFLLERKTLSVYALIFSGGIKLMELTSLCV